MPLWTPAQQVYSYRDDTGTVLYQVVRTEPKRFYQRRPSVPWPDDDNPKHWVNNVQGVRPVLYRLPELLASSPSDPVFVVEGEKDADALAHLGLVSTTNSGGAGKWRQEHSQSLRGRDVVVIPDNDDVGRDHASAVCQSLTGVAASVKFLPLPGLSEKGDVSDWFASGGTQDTLLGLVAALNVESSDHTVRRKNAQDLMKKLFPPVEYVVQDLFPKGTTTLLGGKAKLGKSALMQQVCLDISHGSPALGRLRVTQGKVLYVDLEMGEALLQERMRDYLRDRAAPEAFEYETFEDRVSHPRLDDGLIHYLEDWIENTPDAVLIVIDTLKAARPKAKGPRTNAFDDDYNALAPLTRFAHDHNVAVVIVHHLTKAPNESDPFDELSGTSGLQAAVDSLVVLRGTRGTGEAALHLVSHRIRRTDPMALRMDERGIWTCLGTTSEAWISEERKAILALLDTSEYMLTPKEVAEGLGKNHNTTKNLLGSMVQAGQAVCVKGHYGLPGRKYRPRNLSRLRGLHSLSGPKTCDRQEAEDADNLVAAPSLFPQMSTGNPSPMYADYGDYAS